MVNSRRKKRAKSVHAPNGETVQKALLGDFLLEDVHLYRVNRHTFTIYVGGESTAPVDSHIPEPGVEFNMANRFDINIKTLTSIDPERPILVVLASCGGDWEAGMQMMSAILHCPNPVTVLGTKWTRSMTSLIPLAADKFALQPPSQYMFHHGTCAFGGLAQEFETFYAEHIKSKEMMVRLYISRLKEQGRYRHWGEPRIRAMLLEHMEKRIDVWLEADEAKRWGFVDEVFEGNWDTFRAKKKNESRRQRLLEVLRRPINVEVKVT